ncbi:MAG: response regulator [Alphaproteobacteria bacterium]|nr:response regulator [Hyphomonas sp.]MBR9808803.1 response regulator [Alphaproteobacteria bacterium]|tara:strand:+ start:2156 stop:2515 length:360 start_codon:yes stop_codon:yes gene_type:complete
MKRSVLVVEDDFLIAYDLKTQMEGEGYDVSGPVGSVEAALKALEAHDICSAVLDIDLHGTASFPVAEALKEKGIPFMFLSGNCAWQLPREFSDVLVHGKPVSVPKLLGELNDLCEPDCC